jgi:hypothetical protein
MIQLNTEENLKTMLDTYDWRYFIKPFVSYDIWYRVCSNIEANIWYPSQDTEGYTSRIDNFYI